jgi:hypothetical protein
LERGGDGGAGFHHGLGGDPGEPEPVEPPPPGTPRGYQDPEAILRAYFDLARFWGDVDHVMALTITELALYARHAQRIAAAENPEP